jgi:hypothetical protein
MMPLSDLCLISAIRAPCSTHGIRETFDTDKAYAIGDSLSHYASAKSIARLPMPPLVIALDLTLSSGYGKDY